MAQFIHYCAQNDRNGNPQRCYVLLDPDDNTPIAAWNEGYYGHDAVPGVWRRDAYHAERITAQSQSTSNCCVHFLRLITHTMCQVIHISVHLFPDHVRH
jgi:hypothetical protein